MTLRPFALLFAALLSLAAGFARADDPKPPAVTQAAPGLTRTILQKFEVPGTNYEMTFMKVELVPGYDVPRHVHPGPETSYVLEGEITYMLDGEAPQVLKPGDTKMFNPGQMHSAKVGPSGAKVLGSYVLEKGKPFMTKVDASGAPIPEPPK